MTYRPSKPKQGTRSRRKGHHLATGRRGAGHGGPGNTRVWSRQRKGRGHRRKWAFMGMFETMFGGRK